MHRPTIVLVLLLLALPLTAQQPARVPTNAAPAPAGSVNRRLLTLSDLTWLGMARTPSDDGAADTDAGTSAYSSGSLAIRYVRGERRLIIPNFRRSTRTGRRWGDLVEYREPAPFTGNDPMAAPALIEVRRWAADWSVYDVTPAWHDAASGARFGGLYWDEARQLLWYQIYGYYKSANTPFLGAVRLLDDVDPVRGETYRLVGEKYGPWWYRSKGTYAYWKSVNQWLVPVPQSALADLDGRKFLIGAGVGSVGGAGHLGPGFHAIRDLPALDTPDTAIPLGLRLADYTNESSVRPPQARRDKDYTFVPYHKHTSIDSGLWPNGYWQMSLDQVNSFAWIETPTKEGILLFGRAVGCYTSYGWNPLDTSPDWPKGPGARSFADPSRPNPERQNGYMGGCWKGAVYRFDPKQVREVARRKRSPYSDGINPENIGNWKTQWPNIPAEWNSEKSRQISSITGNSASWDPVAQELIWAQPTTAEARPTVHRFKVQP